MSHVKHSRRPLSCTRCGLAATLLLDIARSDGRKIVYTGEHICLRCNAMKATHHSSGLRVGL